MKKTYRLTGMTCGNCEAQVTASLLAVESINGVKVSKETQTAEISMLQPIEIAELQLKLDPKYQISVIEKSISLIDNTPWLSTYKPILLVFGYLLLSTILIQWRATTFDVMQWMQHFMGGFFLVFSFFKFLNLNAFANSYAMYDIIAKRMPIWGYIYAFVELGLGVLYLINYNLLVTNSLTFVVMSISIIGVIQSVLRKEKIQCACLGAVFNLPMSTLTIIEDALMILMSGWMMLQFI